MLGMVGIDGATGADCGPMPGGKPPGGIGIPGIPGAPTVAVSVAGFTCTKLRLFGKSKVSAPGETAALLLRYPRPFAAAEAVGRPAVVDLTLTTEVDISLEVAG